MAFCLRSSLLAAHLVGVCLVAAGVARAQTCFAVPTNTPQLGAPSQVPFGNNNPTDPIFSDTRYQVLVPAAMLGGQPLHVCDVEVAPAGTRLRTFDELTVTLAHNAAGQLNNPMSGNLHAPATTTTTRRWLLPTTANSWAPMGLAFDFDYDPSLGDLVVEFRVRGGGALTGSGTAGLRTDQALPYGWTAGGGDVGSFFAGGGIKLRLCTDTFGALALGGGCAGAAATPTLSYAGSAQRGGAGLSVTLGQAPPATPAAALVWSFGLRTDPLDLSALGAPGCFAHVFGDVVYLVPASQGAASFSFSPPASAPACVALWNQWVMLDPGQNPAALVVSNPGRVLVGG